MPELKKMLKQFLTFVVVFKTVSKGITEICILKNFRTKSAPLRTN